MTASGIAIVTIKPSAVDAPCDRHGGAKETFSDELSLCAPIAFDSNWYWKPPGPVGHKSTQTESSLHAIPPPMLLPPVMESLLCCVAMSALRCCASKRT